MYESMRSMIFRPYLPGEGPVFYLRVWDTGTKSNDEKIIVGYSLKELDPSGKVFSAKTLFSGDDFHCSPVYSPVSDKAVLDLMHFLTLRPGDVDDEYFKDYTSEQLEYCEKYAEALSAVVEDNLGERR